MYLPYCNTQQFFVCLFVFVFKIFWDNNKSVVLLCVTPYDIMSHQRILNMSKEKESSILIQTISRCFFLNKTNKTKLSTKFSLLLFLRHHFDSIYFLHCSLRISSLLRGSLLFVLSIFPCPPSSSNFSPSIISVSKTKYYILYLFSWHFITVNVFCKNTRK